MHGTCNINLLNAELNPIRHLLALVGARHIVHVSRIRVKPRVHLQEDDCTYSYGILRCTSISISSLVCRRVY